MLRGWWTSPGCSRRRSRKSRDERRFRKTTMAKLSLQGISKRFQTRSGTIQALEDIWLDVEDGEFVVLIGPSGCGKSTLFNIIAGLDAADSGEVWENGHRVKGPGRDRGVVFQDGSLFPWLTAQKNVEFGLKQMGVTKR